MLPFALAVLFAVLAVYSYLLYPVLLLLLVPRRSGADTPRSTPDELPRVTLIVTVHNERARIEEKLANCAQTDYPRDRLEVVVASDGSTDGTDDFVRSFEALPVRLVRCEERLGKENAQWAAIREASGEILVFSDAGTNIPHDALHKLVRNFTDPSVGAVSSEDRFLSADGKLVGEGAYVRYEMWLRRLESRRGGLVGLSGSFFAARRELCLKDWDIHSPSDFNTALNCASAGFVSVSDPEVIGIYKDVADPAAEYRRKVRTVLRGMTALKRHPGALHPRLGAFAFQLWSHKIARWAVPWALLGFLVTSLLLARHPLFAVLFALQVVGYGLVALAHYAPGLRAVAPLRIAYFFVQVNLAIADASLRLLQGQQMTTWTPSQR